MKLICIKHSTRELTKPRRAPACRGTAEIETLLAIPILLIILLMAGVALRFGSARLSNAYDASNNAYAQVTVGRNVQEAGDPAPIGGIGNVRPGLPNRFDQAEVSRTVEMAMGEFKLPQATLKERALFLDPSWHYAAWPVRGDRQALENWLSNYVLEGQPSEFRYALGLQPIWPP